MKVLPFGCVAPILVGGFLLPGMAGVAARMDVSMVLLICVTFCVVLLIPVAIFRAGMNRRRRFRMK